MGPDRPGIVRDLSQHLAERGVSIEEIDTEIVRSGVGGQRMFKVKAVLAVPEQVSSDALRGSVEALASGMSLDVALGDDAPADRATAAA